MTTRVRSSTRRTAWLFLGATLVALAGVVVAQDRGLTELVGSDPGPVVRWSLPVVRLGADVAAAWCLGALTLGAVLSRPVEEGSPPGELEAVGYRMLLTAVRAARVWAVLAFVMVSLTAALDSGLSLGRLVGVNRWWALVYGQAEPRAWLAASVCAALVALAGRFALRWAALAGLALLALIGLCAPLAAGHGSAGLNHDLSTATILVHVPAAALWLGAALTMATTRTARTRHPAALRRYATVTGWCAVVVASTGVVLAGLLVPGPGWTGTPYAAAVAVKLALAAGLLALVWRRRRAVSSASLARSELTLLLLTVAVSVDLTQFFPATFLRETTGQQLQLGYSLLTAPSWRQLAFVWRPEVLLVVAVILMAVLYLRAAHRLGRAWPRRRTLWWLAGCVTLLVVSSSGIARYEAAMFSSHMISHTLLMCFVPLLLVQGAPLTLAAAASRPDKNGPLPSVQHLQRWIVGSRTGRTLTHPVVAVALFTALSFVLYLTPIFDAASRYHWAHVVVAVVSFAIGYLFAWTVVGPDPLARPVPDVARMGMLLAAGPIAVVFPVVVIQTGRVLGDGPASANFYTSLALPWISDLLDDQRQGAIWALALGELSMVVAALMLAARWGRGTDDDQDGVDALRRARGEGDTRRGSPLLDLVEVSESQAVGDDEEGRERHRSAGDQRAQPPEGGERDGDDVVPERPEEVPPNGA